MLLDTILYEPAHSLRSSLFFAHIRASTGTAVQQSNCHPFRHGRWMFMHNGAITGFHLMRRDLTLLVGPALYADIEGTTNPSATCPAPGTRYRRAATASYRPGRTSSTPSRRNRHVAATDAHGPVVPPSQVPSAHW